MDAGFTVKKTPPEIVLYSAPYPIVAGFVWCLFFKYYVRFDFNNT
jgi:hypothetical protein